MSSSTVQNTIGNLTTNNLSLTDAEKEFSAFSGADIVAYIGATKLGTLQGVSVSITREVMPLFTMGNASPVAFSKGKRGIAGNLVFTQFDRHAILKMLEDFNAVKTLGQLSVFRENNQFGTFNLAGKGTGPSLTSGVPVGPDALKQLNDNFRKTVQSNLALTAQLVSQRQFKYADQVPPFDITITMVNEVGNPAFCTINGVQLVNEGFGWTIDDLQSEAAFTFVARSVNPLNSYIDINKDTQILFGSL